MRTVFVSPTDLLVPRGGRAMLSRSHRDQLRELLGEAATEHMLATDGTVVGKLRGYIDGSSPAGISSVIDALDAHDADTLWLDGSNLGRIAQGVKRLRPSIRIITFCHNVEARFFLGAFRRDKSLRATGVIIGNYTAERLAIRYSDDVVALSERDSAELHCLYGRAADAIAPMVLDDQALPTPSAPATSGSYLLFVGGGFYANIAGIRWFAQEVAPRINLPVKIVGRDMDELAYAFSTIDNVELVGAADDLAPWYAGATLVIAPIFDGSGMKTKVAEALMYGKRIAATPEALSGYASDVVAASWCCTDADAFVNAVAEVMAAPPPPYDLAMRALYERDHSPAAGAARLARIMNPQID